MKRVGGRAYGQRVPPLTSVIKSILERYPDGGQILKEIIQNADDASATTVSFLLDSRNSHYGTSSLLNPELGKFQGPALYSVNNAQFKQEDWDGLESLMDSKKKEEPLKVGRFGIGFNSIYHVTDLPSVVSGNHLAFLDPHEVYFGKKETGQQFDLTEPLLDNYRDQFSPFEGILGYKISESVVDGTIFRFPLRNEASKLVQKPYTIEKVRCLFQSLKEEASLILLFLKNIEEICIYETNEHQNENLTFRVRLSDACRQQVRQQRLNFLNRVSEWENGSQVVLKLDLEMDIEIFDESIGTRQEKWLTHNMIGDDESKMREKALTMHLLPWVGFAAPITTKGVRSIGCNGGRIFCFLPLPPDADSKTGYPVHVHGYFGLTDNRRGLKWPGPECQNDDMAEWNVDLMKYIGIKAYSNLLEAMALRLQNSQISEDMINSFYQCWPNSDYVNKHWKEIIEPLFKLLLKKSVFWTSSHGGKWLSLDQAVFERLGNCLSNIRKVVIDVLHLANEPIVSLPCHVDRNIPPNTCTVTPSYCRALLKKNRQGSWDIANMNRNDKLAMLEYIVSDNNSSDLIGIALLPLANGSFTSFKAGWQCPPNDVIYVESGNNKMALLEGMEKRFLDSTLKKNVLSCLTKTAVPPGQLSGCPLQLALLEPQTVIHLLKQALPSSMFQSSGPVAWYPSQGAHPSEAWLELFWKWLHVHETFSYDLSLVEGFPLIKCSIGQNKALEMLIRSKKTIKQRGNGSCLPDEVVSLLKKAGVTVLYDVPYYMSQHACLSTYIADATPEGVLEVLQNVGTQRSIAAVVASNAQTRRSLRTFLSTLRTNLPSKTKMFLKSLPIFEAIDKTSFKDAQNNSFTAPLGFDKEISLKIKNASNILSAEKIKNASNILSAEDLSSRHLLLNVLQIPVLTMGQFVFREVLPHLSCYTAEEVTTLICWVLRRIDAFRSEEPKLCSYLSSVNFVDSGKGRLLRPQDLFDPRNKLNKRLFEGEESKFPIGEYTKEDILVQLNALGLKATIDHEDLVALAGNLHSFEANTRNRKAAALLESLNTNPSLLKKHVNISCKSTMVQNYLLSVAWVPCEKISSPNYPECMPLRVNETTLFRPSEVVSSQHDIIVGAVMPVLQANPCNVVQSSFGWDKPPDASRILDQLRIACKVVQPHSLRRDDRFARMLKLIYKALAAQDRSKYYSVLHQVDFPWIWNGQGFSSPSAIAFRRQTNFELEPYLYTIPEEMKEEDLDEFFSMFGVKGSFTEQNLLDVLVQIKMKHEQEQMNTDIVANDKRLAINILQWIVKDGPLREELREKVNVPVMSDPCILKLVPVSESTFCDAEWLRGNYTELERLPELCELSLIDENISNPIAFNLGVPPMSQCVTKPEMLGFEQAGPYEPITTRLKNILEEYKEGAGVFKELIQNADDAGATEVKFLVDWRQHPAKKLLSEGMKEAQGPALLAYNNAIFTREDFQNINKLAGATKKEDLEKIGRFGLGFNSVYHITDTPSFLSSDCIVFFDPDTNHLKNLIKTLQHPGIKINLRESKNAIPCYPDQFHPYQGVFGCDVSGEMPFNYDGTLFRFPFRRSPSEICDKQYSKDDVKSLLQTFHSSSSTLLLNTQNVRHVTVWELDQRATSPTEMKLLMKVERSILHDSGGLTNTTFLQDCANWAKHDDHDDIQPPQRTKMVSLASTADDKMPRTDYWIQCDRMGDGESLEVASSKEGKEKGLLSCAGVAVNLKRVEKSANVWSVQRTDGEVFCFLPLSIPTGLPVHVNGYFAITSNRRGIWEQTAEETTYFQPVEARWNKALMKDGIAKAYLEILKEAKRMTQGRSLEGYTFSDLWPNPDRIQSQVWKPLIIGVYSLIASSSIPLLQSGDKWYSFTDCSFPDDDLVRIPGSLQILQQLGCKTVRLSHFAQKGFRLCSCGEQIQEQTITQEKFLKEMFFPNIHSIAAGLRNEVICFLIDGCLISGDESKESLYKSLLSTNSCIPCSSTQDLLKKPSNLVHPHGDAAALYSPHENKVPVGSCFVEPKRLLVLEELGMAKDKLSWDQICDRAQSIKSLAYENGLRRVSNLIRYLNSHISEMPPVDPDTKRYLVSLEIFPVMRKPESWFYPWRGETVSSTTMMSSSELFDKSCIDIVGSVEPILDETSCTGCGNLTQKVRDLFLVSNNEPNMEQALNQLLQICEHFEMIERSPSLHRMTNRVCNSIYSFLQGKIGKDEELRCMKSRLMDQSWIFVEDSFVRSTQLAFEWDRHGAPYLYRVPRSLTQYSELLEKMTVRRKFSIQDILLALENMKTDKEERSLNDDEFMASKEFLDELSGLLDKSSEDLPDNRTPMPDQDKVLRPAEDLVINDAPWVTITDDIKYIHKDVSINLAHKLGASDVRSKSLEDISRSLGQPFGQKELLTDRLAGILKAYPCDFGILKELLQNADDAKATEIHFVYDPREHKGERLFKGSWKELQGPALCVYNDRPFSEKDLEGIQRLGIGSKSDSPEKTGQYGIGFNSVYHLTDCPSFITNGNTLCILDPHARYAPGATKEQPGRLIGPFEATHTESFRDVFPGYLGDFFDLEGSTMFRFPLRNKEMANKSEISQKEVLSIIKDLLSKFRYEAKESLLFLNYVKKVSISKIEEGELKLMYEVSANLQEEDEIKRCKLAAYVKETKHLPTSDIERFGIFYPITLKDRLSEEKWLVQQTVGVDSKGDVPDGNHNGLLPRAGVAAKVISSKKVAANIISSKESSQTKSGRAFCFLPLPVLTGLPLHVNGHFALDSGRRHLWQDEDEKAFKSKWNHFMKTEMVADAYINLLIEARKYIPNLKVEERYFTHEFEANYGLRWYEDLFPSPKECNSAWKDLSVAVLKKIISCDKKVLPLIRKTKTEKGTRHTCSWLSSSESFFPSSDCGFDLSTILRNLGFNLVSLKREIYSNFKDSNPEVKEVSPDVALKFLSIHTPLLKELPCEVKNSKMESAANVLKLLEYCMISTTFAKNLDGVPLLLTKDEILRVFSRRDPVYVSRYSNLINSDAHNDKFAKNEIVQALKPVCQELFKQSPQTVLELNLANLATFFPFIFQGNKIWSVTTIPVCWDPDKQDPKIRLWLIQLWEFIVKKHKKQKSESFLEPLRKWPVIPVKSGYLLPVALSKTVLNLTESDSWSPHQKHVVKALQDLRCPEVDIELMEEGTLKRVRVSDVLKPYLAYPNSISDVVSVLDALMKSGDISGRLGVNGANLLLQFLQEDSKTLRSSTNYLSVLRKLPFYETIDGRLISLKGASSVCKVPPGIPLNECSIWMEGTRNIFLQPCPALDLLHELLGVQLKSHVSCYIDFIFPRFNELQESTRMEHLSFIKDELLLSRSDDTDVRRLEAALKQLRFIPHIHSGELHTASHYYDPRNPVFEAMLSEDKFPGEPFREEEWVPFLCRIGLQTTFTKDQFLHFAKEVETEAEQELTKALIKKSQVLIEYLFQEESLHEANFLNVVSTIKFVVPHKVEAKYTSLIKQHLFEDNSTISMIPFKNSLPRKHDVLVWGCATFLPDCAWPSDEAVRRMLGIAEDPTLQQVKVQVQKLCKKFESKDHDLEKSISNLLLKVMPHIYSFLQNELQPLYGVKELFRTVPLVLVEEGRVFVRCEQIAFEMYREQPPYLYKVPREFGQFEILFKCLGATEKPCPSQYAAILEILWMQSKGQELNPEEMRHVVNAMRGLFRNLKRLHKTDEREKTTTCSSSLQSVQTLYLPDVKKQMKPSSSLYYASYGLLKRIDRAEFTYDLLHDLNKVLAEGDLPEEILGHFPPRLQVIPLSRVLVEEIHTKCFDRKCEMDEADKCQSARRLRSLLTSGHLNDGILRILMSQHRSEGIGKDLQSKVENLATIFKIVCLESLETVLKNAKGEEQHGSETSKDYFTRCDENNTCIFIQHGAKHYDTKVSYELCAAVNKYIGNAVDHVHISHLEFIILHGLIKQPTEIPSVLDDRGIERYTRECTNEEPTTTVGSTIPPHFEELLIMDLDFLFRPDEIVGYEKEENHEDGKYIYARIVRETAAPNLGGRTKKAKRDSTTGKRKTQNPLLRKYLIDIGSGTPIEVDALDLYKLKRPEEVSDSKEETPLSESQDVVPYIGEEQAAGASASKPPNRPGIPPSWEKAVKEIDKALADIMKLPIEQRNKAIKRLYLRWHPDKNPGMEELATKVVQYMQNKFKRLSEGKKSGSSGSRGSSRQHDDSDWEDFFRNWDYRARRQRASYDNYRRSNSGFTRNFHSGGAYRNYSGGSSSTFGASFSSTRSNNSSYRQPDAKMARIWLVQCRSDLESVKHLFSAKDGFYWLICFQCSQVVEKALKGALYGVSGISDSQLESHDLTSLAYDLKGLPRGPDVVHSAGKLWKYHEAARYPHKHHPAKAPKEVYTFPEAQEAYDIAKNVLNDVEEFIGILHL